MSDKYVHGSQPVGFLTVGTLLSLPDDELGEKVRSSVGCLYRFPYIFAFLLCFLRVITR